MPVDSSVLGESVKPNEPRIRQLFIGRGPGCADVDAFERKLLVIRKVVVTAVENRGLGDCGFYSVTLSARTICYKGMVLAMRLDTYYPDLVDERIESALALVHQRFSTNTFPSWQLSHPFRFLCHNGEINTIRGNINWMNSRRHSMSSPLLGDDLDKLWPIIREGISDSATFDNALELLVAGGYSLAHAMMLMIPEAWQDNPLMDPERRAFYEYHAALMEPWDGPAAIAFTDGRQIGATLDRNGLRPARYVVTDDHRVIMASEVGVLDIPEERIVRKWRLQPGRMLLVDLEQGRIIGDEELKAGLATSRPWQRLLDETQIRLAELPSNGYAEPATNEPLLQRQQAFGYTREDIEFLMAPMAEGAEEAVGSMGADNPVAVLSSRPKPLANYFRQNFAQVTNPAIDSIREQLVMSLISIHWAAAEPPRSPNAAERSAGSRSGSRSSPTGTCTRSGRSRPIPGAGSVRSPSTSATPRRRARAAWREALDRVCAEAEEAVRGHYNILILSDRSVDAFHVPIPSLLATAAVHHHLVRAGLRTETGLIVESGAAREVHHFSTLAGYGAEAVNPWLAYETLASLVRGNRLNAPCEELEAHYIKAIGKGLLKVMAKMGISTYQSYCGAQIFDAVGLSSRFVDKYFTGTATRVEGIGIEEIAADAMQRHEEAWGDAPLFRDALDPGGDYAFRGSGRGPHVDASVRREAPARGSRRALRHLPGILRPHQRAERTAPHPARALRVPFPGVRRRRRGSPRGGRARRLHRQAVLDRRNVVRVDLVRGAYQPRDRDEPDRRPLEYRGGWGAFRPVPTAPERRFHAFGYQAGRVRALRGDHRVPRQRRRAPDQDRAGSEAGRGRAGFPGTRSTAPSRRCATRRRGWASSPRRRTMTSTPSRTSPSSSTT